MSLLLIIGVFFSLVGIFSLFAVLSAENRTHSDVIFPLLLTVIGLTIIGMQMSVETEESCAAKNMQLRCEFLSNNSNALDDLACRCIQLPKCTRENCTYIVPQSCNYDWEDTEIYSLSLSNELSGSQHGSMGGSFFLGIGSVGGSMSGEMHETSYYYYYTKDKYGGLNLQKIAANEVSIFYTNSSPHLSIFKLTDYRKQIQPYLSEKKLNETDYDYFCMDTGPRFEETELSGKKRLYIPYDSVQLEFNPNMGDN